MPIIAALVGYLMVVYVCTFSTQYEKSFEAMELEDNLAAFATEIESKRQLITNYARGWALGHLYATMHKQGSRASFLAARYQKETRHAFRWGSVAMVAFLYARVSMNIDLSHFVVLLNAFKGIAAGLESIAADLGQISIGLAALRKVADALNSETQRTKKLSLLSEPPTRERNEARPSAYAERLAAFAASFGEAGPPDCIFLEHAAFELQFHDEIADAMVSKTLLAPTHAKIVPGVMCSLLDAEAGDSGSGKSSLLQLLAGEIAPTSGLVYVPPGYRTCRVPAQPLMFDGTLMYNLRLSGPPCSEMTIWRVCRRLGMSEAMIGNPSFDVGANGCRIPLSDVAVVALARALLSQCDFLYIGQTLDMLSPPKLESVMACLRDYVDDRGFRFADLGGDDVPLNLRRKKLIVIITKSPNVARHCQRHMALHADGRVTVHAEIPETWRAVHKGPAHAAAAAMAPDSDDEAADGGATGPVRAGRLAPIAAVAPI